MSVLLAEKVSPRKMVLFAGAALGAVATARFFGSRQITSANRWAECLLDTHALSDALGRLPDSSAQALAACAAYISDAAYFSARGMGLGTGTDDPIGSSRTHTHSYSGAAATVRTEAVSPERVLTYAVDIPTVGEIRGSRHIGPLKLHNYLPARSTPDIAQITLGNSYSSQVVTDFYTVERILAGRDRVFGTATMHDNFGNVARFNIAFDGTVLGTITCDNRIVGRLHGVVGKGVDFKPNQIQSGGHERPE